MESILKKHWPILLEDLHLKTLLPNIPKVTYRRAPNIKNKIAPSKLKPCPTQSIPHIYAYSHCLVCFNAKNPYAKHAVLCNMVRNNSPPKEKLNINEFYNCSSDFVVYCLCCPCHQIYVGCTTRTLRQRFGEHRRKIEEGKDKHNVPRHLSKCHKGSTDGLKVWVVEQMPKNLSEAERFFRLCEHEIFWIYSLDALSPGGMNEALEISTIL